MALFAVSFIAGLLTVLAPCILPLLPVVIGSSGTGRSKATPYVVVGSLAISIILFTYLLKVSSLFINIPPQVWTYLSGGIVILFGIEMVFPALWENIPGINKLSRSSNALVGSGYQKKSFWGDVLIGAALGPVFTSCSPTYFVILATVLPASFALGSLYLFAYVFGLSIILLLIALLGDSLSQKLSRAADSRGILKRIFGVLFIALGLLIITGSEAQIETWLLNHGVDLIPLEQKFLEMAQ